MKRLLTILLIGTCLYSNGQFHTSVLDELEEAVYDPICQINFSDQNIHAIIRNGGVSYISIDSGKTWLKKLLEIAELPNAKFIDSDLISTKKGDFISLSIVDTSTSNKPNVIVCHQYNYKDEIWETLDYFSAPMGNSYSNIDLVYDRTYGNLYASWKSIVSNDEKYILFSSSSKGGKKWEDPKILNTKTKNGDSVLSKPAIIANHEGNILTCWANNNSFLFDRSFNKGKMWLRNDIEILDRSENLFFDFDGIGSLSATPRLSIDLSLSPLRGNVYLVWNELKDKLLDTYLIKSGSSGDTWSQPTPIVEKVEDVTVYLPKVAVDRGTGIVYVAYFRREKASDYSELYLAFSRTGGTNFKSMKISEKQFKHFPVYSNSDIMDLKVLYGIISITYVTKNENKATVINTVISKDDIDY